MRKDEKKALWLKRNFNEIVVSPLDKGLVSAMVPNLFSINDAALNRLKWYRHLMRKPEIVTIQSVCAVSLDERHGLRALFDKIHSAGPTVFNYYLPKDGQAPLQTRASYELIHKNHPNHDHEDPNLYDFEFILFNGSKTIKEKFEKLHCHLRVV